MKITLKESHGWRLLWRTVIRPEVFDRIVDDRFAPARTGWGRALEAGGPSARQRAKWKVRALASRPGNHVFEVRCQRKPAGCFFLFDLGNGEYEVHTLLQKWAHGLLGVAIGRYATRFGLSLPYVNKLKSFCPANLPETYLYAKMCGWKSAGESAVKWVKNGIAYAQKIVEISKGDLPCLYSQHA